MMTDQYFLLALIFFMLVLEIRSHDILIPNIKLLMQLEIDVRQTFKTYSSPQKMMGNLFSITIKAVQMLYSFNLRAHSAGSSIRDELWGTLFLLTLSTNLLTASTEACVWSTTQISVYLTQYYLINDG